MDLKNLISLSHDIDIDTPSYNNQGGFSRKPLSSIKEGRTANSELWTFNNHVGTHIDFPRHFFEDGETLSSYKNSFFVSDRVEILELNQTPAPGSLVQKSQVQFQLKHIDKNTEILLIKTNFEQFRKENIYWKNNIGYHSGLANLFRDHFKNLKIIGFDSISLTSLSHREMGAEAHRAFLGDRNQPILIIEDMHLSKLSKFSRINYLYVVCFPVKNADGTPVNCLAEIDNL